MEVKIETHGDVVKAYLEGDLDINSSDGVTKKLLSLVDNSKELYLDMSGCRYISSSGLRTLLTVYKTAKLTGCKVKLENLTESVNDVIQITGFGLMFNS